MSLQIDWYNLRLPGCQPGGKSGGYAEQVVLKCDGLRLDREILYAIRVRFNFSRTGAPHSRQNDGGYPRIQCR